MPMAISPSCWFVTSVTYMTSEKYPQKRQRDMQVGKKYNADQPHNIEAVYI